MGSPSITLARLPGVSMSNTTMGMWFSFAQGCGGEVHHAQATVVDFVVGDFREFGGGGVFLGVGGVDAVDACALEHHHRLPPQRHAEPSRCRW